MSCTLTHRRAVGDTLSKFQATLLQDGAPLNLTGFTVKFYMYDSAGAVVVNGAAATVTSAIAGEVEYDFQAADVDEAGSFYGWFKMLDGALELNTYPDDEDGIGIEVFALAEDRTTPDPTISEIDIVEAAKAPRRVRTVEGTVEERSINELIKADQYNAAKVADTVPWGIRIAKSKPPSTLS